MSCNKKVLIPCITPSLKSPIPSIHVSTSTLGACDAQASLTNYFWSMWEERRTHYHTHMPDLTNQNPYDSRVLHIGRWWWMSCFWAGRFQWDVSLTAAHWESETFFSTLLIFTALLRPAHTSPAAAAVVVFVFFLWARCWQLLCSSHRSKRGSNGLDYDSKRWLWGHCLDAASRESPQPPPPLVSLFLLGPVRHCVSQGPSFLMESR